jgi:hypothetical protein
MITQRGRDSVFRGKVGGTRVQGIITRDGWRGFKAAKQRLIDVYASVFGDVPHTVSHADVIEFLARGQEESRGYFEWRKQKGR